MIKYLGSKRKLVGVLGDLAEASGATVAVDLFTGTTRVAQEFKKRGMYVYANDMASYSEVFGQTYIDTNASSLTRGMWRELTEAVTELNGMAGEAGYFTRTFCEESRYFQPKNGERVDAIRSQIEKDYAGEWLYPILLTSLIEAADKVDSTVGLQMAYLKKWASRARADMRMSVPELLPGSGVTTREDASLRASDLWGSGVLDGGRSVTYLDPPYNQHSYYGNYHIWETLVKWDEPDGYGIANKRSDVRASENKSPFNSKRRVLDAMEEVVGNACALSDVVMISYSNEGFVSLDEMTELCNDLRNVDVDSVGGRSVRVLSFDNKRHVGNQIGVYGRDGSLKGVRGAGGDRNIEYVFLIAADDVLTKMEESVRI